MGAGLPWTMFDNPRTLLSLSVGPYPSTQDPTSSHRFDAKDKPHIIKKSATPSANNSTSNAVNGSVENATAEAGQIAGGASFNGSSAGISLGNPSTWAMGSSDYTFAAWIEATSNPAALGAILQKDAVGERQETAQRRTPVYSDARVID